MTEPWPVYAFDNHFEGADRPYAGAERWDIVKALGFDGIWLSINFNMPERVERMRRIPAERARTGLGVVAYTILELDAPFPEAPNVFDLLEVLGAGDTLELALTAGWMRDRSDPAHDAKALAVLRRILRAAAERGVVVSLYPHYGFWMERVEDCTRLARGLQDPRPRVTFSASHWYCLHLAGAAAGLTETIADCAPWLHGVNLCGSRPTPAGSGFPLPATIECVGEGDFDAAELAAALRRNGFGGWIGFQGYGIGGDPRENLGRSLQAWRSLLMR